MLLQHLPKKKLILLAGDIFIISLAIFLSPAIRTGVFSWEGLPLSAAGIIILGVYATCFYLADLYDTSAKITTLKYFFKIFTALLVAFLILTAVFFIFPPLRLGRGEFFINAALIVFLTYFWRSIFAGWLKNNFEAKNRLLIIGAGQAGHSLYEAIKNNPDYEVIGFLDDDSAKWGRANSPLVLGGCALLNQMVAEDKMDSMVIAIKSFNCPDFLKNAINCKMKGVNVYDMPSFYEELTGKIPVQHVDDHWFVATSLPGLQRNVYTRRIKRMLDITLASVGFLLCLPIVIFTALAIGLDSPGPVFYRQKRTGLNGKVFEIVKFRSMRTDAEQNGAVWAKKEDSRVTRVGKIIRKLRIDEIPQLWNVLKDDMSLVGPRPERPEFVAILDEKIPYYSLRHSVKPGITGWAQVLYPYGASEEDALEKLQYDFFYIKNRSPLLDLHILLKTVRVVLWGRGAR